jgi:hypothetical protein
VSNFVNTYIKPYAKAITAAIVGGVVLLAAKAGFNLDDSTTLLLTVVIGGAVNGILVWLVPNKPAE